MGLVHTAATCCSSTSRRPASTRRTARTSRSRCAGCTRSSGTTIVLTTHYLDEADALADRVIVIDHGLVIADDTASRLKSELGDLVTLGFDRPKRRRCWPPSGASWALGDHTPRSSGSVRRSGSGPPGRLTGSPGWSPTSTWPAAPVRRVEVASPTLDDVFLELTGRSLRETHGTAPTRSPTQATKAACRDEHPAARARHHPHPEVSRTRAPVARRHRQRHGPRAAPGLPRAGLGAVRDGPAAGLPRAVRAAAARGRRTARRCSGSCPASSR